jgi:hypothetical protein
MTPTGVTSHGTLRVVDRREMAGLELRTPDPCRKRSAREATVGGSAEDGHCIASR